MTPKISQNFRSKLSNRRDMLLRWLKAEPAHQNVNLGNVKIEDAEKLISQHDNALRRIDNGKFGQCSQCNGEVEPERLELDFTTEVCLAHYSEAQIRQLERDLELAAKIQQHLLPRTTPSLPGMQIAVHSKPAQIIGGDYFDFFNCPDGAQGVAIADVMGKGLSASMLMANLQASLRILGPEYDELHELATRLNELFRYNIKLMSFISLFLARIDMKKDMIHYCNAGHHPAFWWQAASGTSQWLEPTGPAIGLTHDGGFSSRSIQFERGDLLLLYTDGLIEAKNTDGEEFGEERLSEFVKRHFDFTADDFLLKLLNHTALFAAGFDDDITLLVIKF